MFTFLRRKRIFLVFLRRNFLRSFVLEKERFQLVKTSSYSHTFQNQLQKTFFFHFFFPQGFTRRLFFLLFQSRVFFITRFADSVFYCSWRPRRDIQKEKEVFFLKKERRAFHSFSQLPVEGSLVSKVTNLRPSTP